MTLTPAERRKRICQLAEADGEYQKLKEECDRARRLFDAFILTLPERDRNLLQTLPGMEYFLSSRMLTLVSENMTFPDEKQ